jgi:DNA invertase Pin-like site-specific DNA recombinase
MMAQAAPKLMDGYIRVSRSMGREGPGYISKDVQREAIERWADHKGVTIAAWHEDEDETGGTQDRPGLLAAVDRAVDGETGGIVSWKIDRLSRYTEGGLRDLRRLDDAGARLAFVVEDIDTSGPMGRFVYTLMLAMGECFLATIKAGWVTAKTKAIGRGAHIGPTPLGYLRNKDGTLQVDPDAAPAVTEAFEVAAAGGLHAAMRFLALRFPDRRWTAFTTRRFLGQRVYLGRVAHGDDLVREGAHDALAERATFEAVQQAIGDPGERRRLPAGDFPLTAVASCGTCGSHLVGGRGGGDKRRVYRCAARCEAPVIVSAEPLEAHVVEVLRAAFDHPGFRVGGASSAQIGGAVQALEDAERELDAFAGDLQARRLLGGRYHAALQVRVDAVEQAQRVLREQLAETRGARIVVPAELWDDLSAEELGEVLAAGLDTVVVLRGRGPIAERCSVVPKGLDAGAAAAAQDAQERGL